MKHFKLILVFFTLLAFESSFADEYFKKYRGVIITPSVPAPTAVGLKAGQKATIKLKLCFAELKSNHHKHECRNIKEKDVEYIATFPDAISPVFNDVKITKKGSEYELIYQTPVLVENSANTFTLTVRSKKKRENDNSKIKAKLEKLTFLVDLKIKLLQFGLAKAKKSREIEKIQQSIALLTNYKRDLENIIVKVENVIQLDPQILAKFSYPLQVGNKTSSVLSYFSTFDGYRLAIEANMGSPIEGMNASIEGKVINLSHKTFEYPEFNDGRPDQVRLDNGKTVQEVMYLYFKNNLVRETRTNQIAYGEVLSYKFETPSLSPSDINNIKLSFIEQKDYKRGPHKIELRGEISTYIPVADDSAAPIWSDVLPIEDTKIVSSFPHISGIITDTFGRIDPDSLKLEITATYPDGTSEILNKTNSLSLMSLDGGASYKIDGSFTEFTEGSYVVRLYGADKAQNYAPTIIRSFNFDTTPPELVFLNSDNIITGKAKFQLKASVDDKSPTTTKIFQNSVLIKTTELKTIDIEVTLVKGTNSFRLESIDSVGNQATPIELKSIILDFTPPIIAINTQDNQIKGSPAFPIEIVVTDQSAVSNKILHNGVEVHTTSDKVITFTATLKEGQNTFETQSIDEAGNIATPAKLNSIILDTTSPVITLTQQGEHLTNNPSYLVNGLITDASTIEYSIFLNGNLIRTSTEKNFSVDVALSEGKNLIEVRARDQVGNDAMPVSISNITLDTVRPLLSIAVPTEGKILKGRDLIAKAHSNEALKTAHINGSPANLSQDKLQIENVLEINQDGETTLLFQAKDLAGNSSEVTRNVIIDNTPPEVQIISRHGIDTTERNYFFRMVINEIHNVQAQVFFNGLLLDQGTFKSFEQAVTLKEGDNSFLIKVTDEAGNSTEYPSRKIVVDSTPPTIASTTQQNILTNNRSFNINATFEENADIKYELIHNGNLLQSDYGKDLNTIIELKEGLNNFILKAEDLAGNKAQDLQIQNITLDSIKPEISSVNSDNILTKEKTYKIQVSVADVHIGETSILQNDVEIFKGTGSSIILDANLREGKNHFVIKSTDLAKNESSTINLRNITYNSTKPVITSNNKSNNIVTDTEFVLNATVADDLETNTVVKLNGVVILQTVDKSITHRVTLKGGSNQFEIISTDTAGNRSDVFTLSNIYLDNIAPIISSTTEGERITNKKDLVLNATIEDVSNVETKVFHNGNLIYLGNSKALDLQVTLKEGPNSFEIKVSDLAGNSVTPLIIKNIVLDTIAPIITSNSAYNIRTKNPLYFVNASAYDLSSVTFKLLQNSQEVYSADGSFLEHIVTLTEGSNKLEFIAIDAAGNESESYIVSDLILDTQAPVINLASTTGHPQTEPTFIVSGTVTDQLAYSFQIFQNGALVYEGSQSPFSYTANLSSGNNSFYIVGTDELGNISPKVEINNVYLDNVAPSIILGSVKKLTKEKNFILRSVVEDASDTVSKIFHNGSLINTTNSKIIDQNIVLTEGTNDFTISATDSKGNEAIDLIFVVELDSKSPTINFNPNSDSTLQFLNLNQGIAVTFQDDHKIDFHRLRVRLNGEMLEEKHLNIMSQSNQVIVLLANEDLPIIFNKQNILSVEIADELQNLAVASAKYTLIKDQTIGDNGPVINFKPSGGVVEAPISSIEVGFSSNIGIYYNSLSITINGFTVPSNKITIEPSLSKAVIDLSFIPQTANDIGLLIAVSISDTRGVRSQARVGINYFIDPNSRLMAEIVNDNAYGGTGYVDNHVCVVLITGEAKCWGNNLSGELGLAIPNSSIGLDGNLAQIPNVNLGERIRIVRATRGRTCAIVESGNLYCWGGNFDGGLGYANTVRVGMDISPKDMGQLNVGEKVKDVALGIDYICALLESSQVKCWGKSAFGALGYGQNFTWSMSKRPIDLPYVNVGGRIKNIASGAAHVCALIENGEVRCWGFNSHGQLGYGHKNNIGDNEVPADVGSIPLGEKAVQIVAGYTHTCAILESGKLRCWGDGSSGKLGLGNSGNIGDNEQIHLVEPILLDEQAIQVSLGFNHTCALFNNKKIKCWGSNSRGQLGLGQSVSSTMKPNELGYVDVGADVKSVRAMQDRTCVTLVNDKLKCWGDNSTSLLGLDHTFRLGDDESITSKGHVPTGISALDMEIGPGNVCIFKEGGKVKCWGDNLFRTVGPSSQRYIGDDEQLSELADLNSNFDLSSISIKGYAHHCGITNSKNIRCWGTNSHGALGAGSKSFVAVNEAQDLLLDSDQAIQIETNTDFSCVLLTTGKVKCWGRNTYGQLGLGHTNNVNIASSDISNVSLPENVTEITSGTEHACALLASGQVTCWGKNSFGQLGIANTNNVGDNEKPSEINPINLGGKAIHITGGRYHTCAILESGNFRCWGFNSFAELGYEHLNHIGDNEHPSSQPEVNLGLSVKQISPGDTYTCALLVSGKMKCWGRNDYGRLGSGNTENIRYNLKDLEPLPIPETITKIGVTYQHSCALIEDGNLYCWGNNQLATLGHSLITEVGLKNVPSTISALNLGADVYFAEPDDSTNFQSVLAHYEPNIYYGQGPLEITFNAITSSSVAGEIATYQWDFGDGSPLQITQGPLITHTFANQGVYSVKLTATDINGNLGSLTQYITVLGENILPVSKLIASVTTGSAPLSVLFDASGSYDTAGTIVNYQFLFGDGKTNNSTQATQTNIFENPGHYSAKVVVTDNNGGKSTSEAVVISIPAHPSAPIISSTSSGHIRTAETSFNINATVEDAEEITLRLFHNGLLIFTGDIKSFNQNINLFEGNNYFEFQATDSLGHAAIPLPIAYIVLDTDLPKIATPTKSNTYTNKTPYPLQIQVSDSTRTTTKIYLNNTLIASSLNENFQTDLNLVTGGNKIEIIATDEFGNNSNPYIIDNLVLDTIAPSISEVKPDEDSIVTKTKFPLSGKSNEVLENVTVNGIAMVLSSDKLSFSGEQNAAVDGNYNITLTAMDRAGNEFKKNYKVLIDTLPPLLSSTNTSGYISSNSTYMINANVNDLSGTTTEIYHNGRKVYTTSDKQINYETSLIEGGNTFILKSYDINGNEVNPTYIGDINLDSTAPVIVSNIASDTFTNQWSFPLEFSVLDSRPTTTKIFKNGTEIYSTTSKSISTTVVLSLEKNDFKIMSMDDAGNASIPIEINNIYLDRTVPVISLVNPKDKYTTDQKVLSINGSVEDEIGVKTKFIHNGSTYSSTNLKIFSEAMPLDEGFNNIEIIAEDEAGNISSPVSLRDIGLDSLPPVLASSTTGDKVTFSSTQVVNVKIQDYSAVTTELFVDGSGVYLSSSKDFNFFLPLKPGPNVITAISSDKFGNQSALFRIGTITYDNAAPVIKLASTDNIYTNVPQFNFKAEIEDYSDVISYIYVNDSLVHTTNNKSINVNLALTEGKNSIRIRSDEVGSIRSTVKLLENAVLDTVAPIISPNSPQNFTTNESLYRLSANISDIWSTKAEIYVNNKMAFSTTDKELNVPLILDNGSNTIRVEVKDIAGNSAAPLVLSNITAVTNSSIAATIGTGGGRHSVTSLTSPIYGSLVDVGLGAVNENVDLSVTQAELSDLPNIAGVPTPDPLGPILNITASKRVSSTKTFNKEVVVGIPFYSVLAYDKKVNPANITIIRYDSVLGIVESIKPFEIDFAKGIAYGYTNSFSHFFVTSAAKYPKVAIELPQSCRKQDLGYSCDFEAQNFSISGVFRQEGLSSTSDLNVNCSECTTGTTTTKSLAGTSEKMIQFGLTGNSIAHSDSLRFTFRSGNLIAKEKITINYSVLPVGSVESSILLSDCYESGAICKIAGNGQVAYSADNIHAIDASLNMGLGKIFRPNRHKLSNAITNLDGVLYWIEPKEDFLSIYKIQDLINYRLNEFALRRKYLDGRISTVDTFKVAIETNEILQNEWEYNFNLQFTGDKALFTLDSSHHLYDQVNDAIDVRAGAKLIALDSGSLKKDYLDSSLGYTLNQIKEVKVSDDNIYVLANSLNDITALNYRDGLFTYHLPSNSWEYVSRNVPNPLASDGSRNPIFSPDGSRLADFDARTVSNIKLLGDKLYFIDEAYSCVRRFDSGGVLSTVAGVCHLAPTFKGTTIDYGNALATNLVMGGLESLDVDNEGNIYLAQNLNNKMELSIVSKETGVIKGVLKETNSTRLPVSTEAILLDDVKVVLDKRDDSSISLDSGNSVYFYSNSCVYSIASPFDYLFIQLPFKLNEHELSLNNAKLSDIILSTQGSDGHFSFDGKSVSSKDDMSDSLDALKFLDKTGKQTSDSINKARFWIANQNYSDTKSSANRLEALALLAKNSGSTTFSPELKAAFEKFMQSFRPIFGGWGATENHIINNEDTATAIKAIAFLYNQVPKNNSYTYYYASEFMPSLRRIIGEQFSGTSGIFAGGFGPTNNQNMPTLSITLNVLDSMLEYKKLDATNNSIIAWNKKSEFNTLSTQEIPNAISNAIPFIGGFKKSNGSFGDLRSTIKVLNTYNDILKAGVLTNPTLVNTLKTDIMKGMAYIKTQDFNKAQILELAGLNALDDVADFGIKHAGTDIGAPGTSEPVRAPANVNTSLFGTGNDSVLTGSGVINLNQFTSGDRKYPDAVNTKVIKIIKQYVFVDKIAENALEEGDEVLLINLQGVTSGTHMFARVKAISYFESPILIQLDRDVVAAGFTNGENDRVMLQRVPNYVGISKNQDITITADSFNGELGGVVAFRVQGEIGANVSVDVSSLGYRGGENTGVVSSVGEGQFGFSGSPYYSQSSSCGGGMAVSGFFVGGGGAHATSGSFSSTSALPANSGALIGSNELTKLFFGCGGGSGLGNDSAGAVNGGAGGGIVLIYAGKLNLKTNTISANGGIAIKGEDDNITHGSGGGAGGSVLLNVKDLVYTGNISSNVTGGLGVSLSNGHNGQNGGQGRIRINAKTINGALMSEEHKKYLKQNFSKETPYIETLQE